MDLQSFFASKVNIGGREIPLIAVGAGAGVVLALAVKLRGGIGTKETGPTNTAEVGYNVNAAIQTAQAQQTFALEKAIAGVTGQIQTIQAGVDTSLAGLRAQYLSDLTTQIGQVTSQTQAGLAGLQEQFSGNLAQVRGDVQSLRTTTATQLQEQAARLKESQQTTSGQIQALSSRVTAVEQGQTRSQSGLYNLATWLGRWNLQLMNQLPPAQQVEAGGELTSHIMVPLQATSGTYRPY